MNRFALVIESSNVKGQTDLPGARADAQNWVAYLKSPLGGSWLDSEIVVLNKPASTLVREHLTIHRDDYCFVCFSGHGEHNRYLNETVLCLNEGEQSCAVSKIKPLGDRGTLIVDACRGDAGQRRVRVEKRAATIALANQANAMLNRQASVVAFNASMPRSSSPWFTRLLSAPAGIVTMYSCSIGEGAGEYDATDPVQGGYYSVTLIQVAQAWNQRTLNGNIYTTKNAHDDVVSYFQETNRGQHPEYSPSWLAYPFAVSV